MPMLQNAPPQTISRSAIQWSKHVSSRGRLSRSECRTCSIQYYLTQPLSLCPKIERKTRETLFSRVFAILFEKSNFCPKIQFCQTPNIFTSFSAKFFWHFFSWNQSCQQLKSPKPQHFHEFFIQKNRQFSQEIEVEFFDKNEDFEQCVFARKIMNNLPISELCGITPYFGSAGSPMLYFEVFFMWSNTINDSFLFIQFFMWPKTKVLSMTWSPSFKKLCTCTFSFYSI